MGKDCDVGYICKRGKCILRDHCFSDIDCSRGFECKASYCQIKITHQQKINNGSNSAKVLSKPKDSKPRFLKPTNKVFLKACDCYKSIEVNSPDSRTTTLKVKFNQITTNSSFCSEVIDVFL